MTVRRLRQQIAHSGKKFTFEHVARADNEIADWLTNLPRYAGGEVDLLEVAPGL